MIRKINYKDERNNKLSLDGVRLVKITNTIDQLVEAHNNKEEYKDIQIFITSAILGSLITLIISNI